jgi:cell division protease FtsH
MTPDAWLPRGFALTATSFAGRLVVASDDWQIIEVSAGGRALLARTGLADRWLAAGIATDAELITVDFGNVTCRAIVSGPDHVLAPLDYCRSPLNVNEALAFAAALRKTRAIDRIIPLHDGIYAEGMGCIFRTRA